VLNEPVKTAAARWPSFAAAADAAGFGMVSALPLLCQAQAMGVISVLAGGEWRLGGADLGPAEFLARAAAVAFSQQRELRESARAAAQLQHALDTRVLIEQAKGATAARLGITPEAAFDLLRAYARRESRALADIARETVSGDMPARQLFGPRQGSSRRLTRQSG
jgi:hypothetical protein